MNNNHSGTEKSFQVAEDQHNAMYGSLGICSSCTLEILGTVLYIPHPRGGGGGGGDV